MTLTTPYWAVVLDSLTTSPSTTTSTRNSPAPPAFTKYKAVVTTGAKDVVGNALDQDPSASGNQPKEWYFTTGST